MARQEIVQSITVPAGADLSLLQFNFVKMNSSGQVVAITAVTDRAIGVLLNKPDAAGVAAEVAVMGVVKVICGEACAAGAVIKTDAAGLATDVAIATTEIELGTSLNSTAATPELLEVLIGSGVKGGIA